MYGGREEASSFSSYRGLSPTEPMAGLLQVGEAHHGTLLGMCLFAYIFNVTSPATPKIDPRSHLPSHLSWDRLRVDV